MTASTRSQSVVVVGGGLAGLAAATYLARGGARVTVLERTASPGGRATTDAPDGYALNRGAHALYTGGPASAVLHELGVRYSHGIPSRVGAREASGQLHTFPTSAQALLRTSLLDGAEKRDLTAVFVKTSMLRPSSVAHQSVEDWILSVSSKPKVQTVLRSLARVALYNDMLDLASAEVLVASLQQSMRHPIHYIDGGWQTVVDGLVRTATDAGVQVTTGAHVSEIDASGVRLQQGDLIAADATLVALPLQDAARLLPPDAAPRVHAAAAQAMPLHIACLDVALRTLPQGRYPVVFDLEGPRFITAQSAFARVAPPGGAVVQLLLQLDARSPLPVETQRDQLEAFLSEIQPGWQDHVVSQRFLPRMLACSSLPLASTNGFAGRPPVQSEDRDSLYFAGDWVGPRGFLIDATLASARESARLILREWAGSAKIAA